MSSIAADTAGKFIPRSLRERHNAHVIGSRHRNPSQQPAASLMSCEDLFPEAFTTSDQFAATVLRTNRELTAAFAGSSHGKHDHAIPMASSKPLDLAKALIEDGAINPDRIVRFKELAPSVQQKARWRSDRRRIRRDAAIRLLERAIEKAADEWKLVYSSSGGMWMATQTYIDEAHLPQGNPRPQCIRRGHR